MSLDMEVTAKRSQLCRLWEVEIEEKIDQTPRPSVIEIYGSLKLCSPYGDRNSEKKHIEFLMKGRRKTATGS